MLGHSHSYNMDTSRDSGRYSPSLTSLSRSSSFKSGSRTSLIRRNQSISAKQIRFYRNGDKYFGGLKLAVSPERYKEFDSLLAELSVKLDLASGAVRFVFNAEDGSLITDISQLQYGVPYVCCSSNTFRQLDEGYGKQHSNNWSMNRHRNVSRSTNTLTSLEGSSPREAMLTMNNHRDYIKPKLVTVIKNGKPPQKKVTMLLNQKTAVSFDQVLDHLSAKGSLGKVDKLYAVDGKLVRDLRDLFDDDTIFIAFSSAERFPEEGIDLDPKNALWDYNSTFPYQYTTSIRRHDPNSVFLAITAINAMQDAVRQHFPVQQTAYDNTETTDTAAARFRALKRPSSECRSFSDEEGNSTTSKSLIPRRFRPVRRQNDDSEREQSTWENNDETLNVEVGPLASRYHEVRNAFVVSMEKNEFVKPRRSHIHSFDIK
eukprot:gene7291-8106_t